MQIEEYRGKSADNKNMGNVVISPNIKKESARIDPAGNIIDARTKQIIEPVASESIEQAPIAPAPVAPVAEMSVLEQIEQAKQNLKDLEALKLAKIAEKKAELELLEQ